MTGSYLAIYMTLQETDCFISDFIFPIAVYGNPISAHTHQHLLSSLRGVGYSHPRACEVVVPCDLELHFHNDFEYLLKCSPSTLYLWWIIYLNILPAFTFWIQILYWVCDFQNIFSLSVTCIFTFVVLFFPRTKVIHLVKSSLFFYSFNLNQL